MPCRVGITTDANASRDYWEPRVAGFRDWKVVSSHSTRAAAKDALTDYARRFDCEAVSSDGGPALARWVVYWFHYDHELG